jgi:hypothetical protein
MEQSPGDYQERDLVMKLFDAKGRVQSTSVDDGCGQAIRASL